MLSTLAKLAADVQVVSVCFQVYSHADEYMQLTSSSIHYSRAAVLLDAAERVHEC